ncbi:MAG TPA: GNAT family N-acetyltransferase [Candidatus Limnocylindrales bacterium]
MTDPYAIHELATEQLTAQQIADVRELLWSAFASNRHGGFSEQDWQHALGGTHFVLEVGDRIVSHAAVVVRTLHVAGVPIRTGYVEAVATAPAEQGRGYGTVLMRSVNALIERDFELGALSTGSHGFYERLGWRIWQGPSSALTAQGEIATPDEHGGILYLLTSSSPRLDPGAPIACEWRAGDVW